MNIFLNHQVIKKILKLKLIFSNYAKKKKDINDITHVNTSNFALKTNLANLKTEVDKLDINKLVPIPNDLSKLSNVVKNDAVKKVDYNKLVAKVNNIDTSDFVLKTKYNTDKTELENKLPNTSGLVKKTDYNSKITEIKNKIPDISNLATKAALTTVENEIPSISNLATKTKLTTVENKIPNISNLAPKAALTTVENKIPNINNLATKTLVNKVENKIPNISSIVKKSDYNTKITGIENNVRRLQAYDLSYFKGKQYFDEGSVKQNYLVFLPLKKYFTLNSVAAVIDHILS